MKNSKNSEKKQRKIILARSLSDFFNILFSEVKEMSTTLMPFFCKKYISRIQLICII